MLAVDRFAESKESIMLRSKDRAIFDINIYAELFIFIFQNSLHDAMRIDFLNGAL